MLQLLIQYADRLSCHAMYGSEAHSSFRRRCLTSDSIHRVHTSASYITLNLHHAFKENKIPWHLLSTMDLNWYTLSIKVLNDKGDR